MIARILYFTSAAALLSTTAVIAQPSGSASNGSANKQICRSAVDTGSRLARTRSCHTAQEWAELRRQTQQNVDRIQSAHASNGN